MQHKGNDDNNFSWCTLDNPQRIGEGTGDLEIRGHLETIQTTELLRLV